MSYSQTTYAYIEQLKKNPTLMQCQTCHDGAKWVQEILGNGTARELDLQLKGQPDFWNKLQDGIYRLDLKMDKQGLAAGAYEHSLALFKKEKDLVLLQCFSRQYTMGEWVNMRGEVANSQCAKLHSPGSPQVKSEYVAAWTMFLPLVKTYYDSHEWDLFDDITAKQFASDKTIALYRHFWTTNGTKMVLKWSFMAFSPNLPKVQ